MMGVTLFPAVETVPAAAKTRVTSLRRLLRNQARRKAGFAAVAAASTAGRMVSND
jgi:hypothetical protein